MRVALLTLALLLTACATPNKPILVQARKPRALLALDPATGATLWSHPRPEHCRPFGKPLLHDGVVYVGYTLDKSAPKLLWSMREQHGDTLFALDHATGEQLWSAAVGRVHGKLVRTADLLCVAYADNDDASAPGHALGLDARSGALRWRADRRLFLEGAAGGVSLWSQHDRLFALEHADGQIRWMTPIRGGQSRAWMRRVHIRKDTLCLIDALEGPALRFLDPTDGAKIWIHEGNGVPSQLSMDDDVINVCLDGKLLSVAHADAELQWSYLLPPRDSGKGRVRCEVLDAKEGVALLSVPGPEPGVHDDTLDLIEIGDSLRWSSKWTLPSRHKRAIGLAPGLVLVRSPKTLKAYEIDDGTPRWTLNVPKTTATFVVGDQLLAVNKGNLICLSLDDVTERWRRAVDVGAAPSDGTRRE